MVCTFAEDLAYERAVIRFAPYRTLGGFSFTLWQNDPEYRAYLDWLALGRGTVVMDASPLHRL